MHRPAATLVLVRSTRTPPDRLILLPHALTLLRGRLLRWRLETFGLYAPSFPNQRPWWRVNLPILLTLARHRHAYARWLREMSALRRTGPAGWWHQRLGARYGELLSYIEHENAAEPED